MLGELLLVYPFIVNDPGEGTQAKRRGHAVVVDHLVPLMAWADSYGELAKEQLLDEYATVQALDPTKLPGAGSIWELVTAAQLHHDLAVDAAPDAKEFDDFVLMSTATCARSHAIRDGLHVLGAAPAGEALVNLVLAVLRATQVWGGVPRRCRGCASPWQRPTAWTSASCWPRRARVTWTSSSAGAGLVEGWRARSGTR